MAAPPVSVMSGPPIPGGAPSANQSYGFGMPALDPLSGGYVVGLPGGTQQLLPENPNMTIPPRFGGGTGTQGGPAASGSWIDSFFASLGLPPDLIQVIENIALQYADNPTLAIQLAQQAIYGSPWFQAKYPGFNTGVANGLFNDVQGYTNYVNQLNFWYGRFAGAPATADQVTSAIGQGLQPDIVEKQLEGAAYASANTRDIEYVAGAFMPGSGSTLGQSQITAYGEQQVGLPSALGELIQAGMKKAAARAAMIFSGSIATPSMAIGQQGLNSPSLAGQKNDLTSQVGA